MSNLFSRSILHSEQQIDQGKSPDLQTLTARARAVRNTVVSAVSTKGSRTKTPVYDRDEQIKLRERIQQTQPEWVLLWWDISVVTGWRTADVCNLRYSCINPETGTATIVVAKQTKAAEAKAARKAVEEIRRRRKEAALLSDDHKTYMRWDSATADWIATQLTGEEQQFCIDMVSRAEVKRDTKQLPPGLLKRLRERQERNLVNDDLVFSRSQIASYRCQLLNGCVTRQSVWRRLAGVCKWFMRRVNSKLRLSAYSTRKIAAYNLMLRGGEQGILIAAEMLGHSSPAITRTYLQLGNRAGEIQAVYATEMDTP